MTLTASSRPGWTMDGLRPKSRAQRPLFEHMRWLILIFGTLQALAVPVLELVEGGPWNAGRTIGAMSAFALIFVWLQAYRRGTFGPLLEAGQLLLFFAVVSSIQEPDSALGLMATISTLGALSGSLRKTILRTASAVGIYVAVLIVGDEGIRPEFWPDILSLVAMTGAVAALGSALRRATATQLQLSRVESERKRLLDRILRQAEEERIGLASELHDGPIQRLAMLGLRLDRAETSLARVETDEASRLITSVRGSVEEEIVALREIMATLRPPMLDQRGLQAALTDHGADFSRRTGVPCSIEFALTERPDEATETTLYRVAIEALTNIAKHARATRAMVSIRAVHGQAVMRIEDDGIGFSVVDASSRTGGDHFGLIAMRERVQMRGGILRVESSPRGTSIEARIPLRGSRDVQPPSGVGENCVPLSPVPLSPFG